MEEKPVDEQTHPAPGTGYHTLDALKAAGLKAKDLAGDFKASPGAFIGRSAAKGAAYGLKVAGAAGEKMHRLAGEGLTILTALERHPDYRLKDALSCGKAAAREKAKNTARKIGDAWEQGREIAGTVAQDVEKAAQKAVAANPGLGRAGGAAVSGVHRIMGLLRLPTRDDVQKLSEAIERLNRRVDSMKDRKKGAGHA